MFIFVLAEGQKGKSEIMWSVIIDYWRQFSFWDKVYVVYAVILCITILCFLWHNYRARPKKKLKFIENAYNESCMTVGKMTCFTIHGNGKPQYYQAEYMYVVDGQRYFVTYKMLYSLPIDDRREVMNADMLLLKLKPALILFYNKNDPRKVMSKLEVFTSEDAIHQTFTPKKNMWRNTERDWDTPIDLVSY
jgi:hypothetical protein